MTPLQRGSRVAIAASLFVCAAWAVLPPAAEACDLCAVYTGTLMREDRTGAWVAASEQFSDFSTMTVDGDEVANTEGEFVHSSITQFVLGYTFAERITIQANLPLISRTFRRLDESGLERGSVGGVGDIALVARYAPLSRAHAHGVVHAEILGGVKLASGETNRLGEEGHHDGEDDDHQDDDHHFAYAAPGRTASHGDEEHGEGQSGVHGHDLTLGTGSTDAVFGASLMASWKRLFAVAQFQYILRGQGDFGYQYADDFTWTLAPGVYALLAHEHTVAVRLEMTGETKDRDTQRGAVQADTGLTSLYMGPGASLTWRSNLHADFALDLPVVQDTTGRQIVPDYRLRAGLAWHF